ncbi:MAG: hypothetical protein Q4E22_05390, partial [Coriobacteriia bacterium]|nr:hypothetical protein [Coriobacteriia bacterium]
MKKILSLLAIIVFVVATAACSSAPEMQNAMTPNAEANKENTATQNEAEAPQEDASNPNEEVAGSDEKLKELNKEAEQAYQEFLEGKRTFARGEAFKVDYEDEVAIDHLKYREYDYQQFIDALEQYQSPLTVLYAFDDIDQDGINEMIINLEAQTNEAENDGFSNWIGFIRYEDKNLSMFSSFIHHNSDGPEWNLYTSGIAEFFNSYEDSLFFRDVYEIDQDGFLQQLFSETTSYNGYVSHLYQVVSGSYNEAMQGEGDYLATHSNLTAREYRKGSEVKITVDNWSKDPQLRAREKKYIDKVVEQNVELISNEQMDELTTLDEDKHKPIAWKTWEKTSPKNI